MTNQKIISAALILIFYHISGLATTNIIRLTRGNTLPILSSKCECDNCGYKIPSLLQLPVISYIFCAGKCKKCKCKIPLYPLILEFTVLIGMSVIAFIFSFRPEGIIMSYVFYEIVRIAVIIIKGKREQNFIKQYAVAVASMIPFWLLTLAVSALIYIV